MLTRLLIASCALGLGLPLALGLKVTPDKENVVASRLEGEWRLDHELTQRLKGKPGKATTLTIRSDPAVAESVPASYDEFLAGKQVFMAGQVVWAEGTGEGADNASHPFLLIEHHGNPHLVMFRERDGDPMGDAESCNLMLAPAKDRTQDLLLIGADFNNEPFKAFERVEREKGG